MLRQLGSLDLHGDALRRSLSELHSFLSDVEHQLKNVSEFREERALRELCVKISACSAVLEARLLTRAPASCTGTRHGPSDGTCLMGGLQISATILGGAVASTSGPTWQSFQHREENGCGAYRSFIATSEEA